MKYLHQIAILILAINLSAQSVPCGNEIKYRHTAKEYEKDLERSAKAFKLWKPNIKRTTDSILEIPVHVVIHHYPCDAYGEGTNITDRQILSQIKILNQYFAHRHADTLNVPDQFSTAASKIRFRLASFDPEGNPTDGVTRYASYELFSQNDSMIISRTMWSRDNFLNLYFTPYLDIAYGYAPIPLPDSLPSIHSDVVTISTEVVGERVYNPLDKLSDPYAEGRIAIHEMGHWLGLRHIWGSSNFNGCEMDDGISDTPLQSRANRRCPTHPSVSCDNDGDMYMNHMDYTEDLCKTAFTAEQVSYMEFILQETRSSLLISNCNYILDATHPKILLNSKNNLNCQEPNTGSIHLEGYDGVAPYSFKINQGTFQSSGSFNNLDAGLYMIEIKDALGNVSQRPIEIVSPPSLIENIEIEIYCNNTIGASVSVNLNDKCQEINEINISGDNYQELFNEVLLSEDFENGIPTGWVLQGDWQIRDSETYFSPGFNIPKTDKFLVLRDDQGNDALGQRYVYLPLTNLNGARDFSFIFDAFFLDDIFFGAVEWSTISISIDQGVSYQDLLTLEEYNYWRNYQIDFRNINYQDVILRIGYHDGFGWNLGLALDNIKIITNNDLSELSLIEGDYTIDVLKEDGCVETANFEISGEDVIHISDLVIEQPSCNGNGSIYIQAESNSGIFDYIFNGQSNTNGLYENLIPGINEIQIIDNNGCEITEIVVLLPWSMEIIEVSTECSSTSDLFTYNIELCVETGINGVWQLLNNDQVIQEQVDSADCVFFEINDLMFSDSFPNTLTAQVIDDLGCKSTFEINLIVPVILSFNATDTIYICENEETYVLEIDNSEMFQEIILAFSDATLLPDSLTGNFNISESGRYIIYAVDNNGCTFSSEFIFERYDNIIIDVIDQSPSSTSGGESIQLEASGGLPPYFFTIDSISNSTGIFTDLIPGTYFITVTDSVGCNGIIEIVIDVASSSKEINNFRSLVVYPNPTAENIIINLDVELDNSMIYLYDAQLRTINITDFEFHDNILPLSNLPSGVYFIKIISEEIQYVGKIMRL